MVKKICRGCQVLLLDTSPGPASAADAQLGLLFTNKEALFGNVIIQGSLGCSDRETVGITIQRGKQRRVAEHRPRLQESSLWVIQ